MHTDAHARPLHVHPIVHAHRTRPIRAILLTLGAEAPTIVPMLRGASVEIVACTEPRRVEDVVLRTEFDILLVAIGDGLPTPHSTLAWIAKRTDLPAAVILHHAPTMTLAALCMRHNVADLIDHACPGAELRRRLEQATKRTLLARRKHAQERRRQKRVDSLRKTLERSRQELADQVGGVCEQLAGSYRDLSGQLKTVALASELETLLRQELEVESLLRTTLEFLLRKVGPTNAAIFLPSSSGDWSLGAYVNYDCPRDAAESMLEGLCCVVAPAFETRPGLHQVRDPQDLCEQSNEPLHWMHDNALIVYSCIHEGECIGVVSAFRDRRTPWGDQTLAIFKLVGELFGQQLHRTIRTHHRHIHKDKWDAAGDGLAA